MDSVGSSCLIYVEALVEGAGNVSIVDSSLEIPTNSGAEIVPSGDVSLSLDCSM